MKNHYFIVIKQLLDDFRWTQNAVIERDVYFQFLTLGSVTHFYLMFTFFSVNHKFLSVLPQLTNKLKKKNFQISLVNFRKKYELIKHYLAFPNGVFRSEYTPTRCYIYGKDCSSCKWKCEGSFSAEVVTAHYSVVD